MHKRASQSFSVLATKMAGTGRSLLAFVSICLFLSAPYQLCAQTEKEESGPVYLDSIVQGMDDDVLSMPYFVWAEPVMDEIYVIEGRRMITVYTSDFFPLFTMGKEKGIESPQGLTVDGQGNLYVAMTGSEKNSRSRVAVFNARLKWVTNIYFSGFDGADSFIPFSIATDRRGNIYVAGYYMPGVLVYDRDYNLIEIMSPEESGRPVKLNNVFIDQKGNIYLTSTDEGSIYVYDENRKFVFNFGEKGGGSGKLSRPQSVGVDNETGYIYVVDYMRHTINVYNRTGKYLTEFGGKGWGPGWLFHPRYLHVDKAGRILVADAFNNRVQIFMPGKIKTDEVDAPPIARGR